MTAILSGERANLLQPARRDLYNYNRPLPIRCSTGTRTTPLNNQNDVEFADLPAHLASPEEAVGTWFVARIRYQRENVVIEDWRERGIVWCMPQTIVTKRYTSCRTTKRKRVALFREYLPCCDPEGERHRLYPDRGGVLDVIPIVDQARFVRELTTVYTANKISPLDPYPFAVEGKRCRVTTGPFAGFEGIVIQRNYQKPLVVLQVTTLGGASIPFDFAPEDLEPVAS